MHTVAVIGGGVAGVSATLHLARLGYDVTLIEREPHLISGPPFCHLHAGGNLYREIDDEQCRTLLRQSIDFARRFPYAVDYRPTVIAVPLQDKSDAKALLPRLEMLRNYYRALVDADSADARLGDPAHYFRLYSRREIEALRNTPPPQTQPQQADEWMCAAAHLIDLERIHYPLVLVQEYGLNLFRLAAGATLTLQALPNVTLHRNKRVKEIRKIASSWHITTDDGLSVQSDYLINAAGFRTGTIDEMLGLTCRRMVEFKAAYVAKWEQAPQYYPEIIFHGERGTPRGMGQFTPYCGGYVQLHAMRKDVTLYENGLVSAPTGACQPPLPSSFVRKIEHGWEWSEVDERTRRAVTYLSRFIPSFSDATTGAKPLYGAQQIPGDDPDLRVAEAAFPLPRYARCEIVKVSSVGDMCRAITEDIRRCGIVPRRPQPAPVVNEADISALARDIALSRDYPEAMARRNVAVPPPFT